MTMPFTPLLAQQKTPESGNFITLIIFLGLLMVAVAGLLIIVKVMRKWALKGHDDTGAPSGFGLGEWRELRDKGLITEEEYQAAKAKITESARKTFLDKPPPAAKGKAPAPAQPEETQEETPPPEDAPPAEDTSKDASGSTPDQDADDPQDDSGNGTDRTR